MDIYTYLPKLEEIASQGKVLSKCKIVGWNFDNRRIYLTLLRYGKSAIVKIPLKSISYTLEADCNLINRLARRELR